MDIFDRLKADHRTQCELAASLLRAAAGAAENRRLFDLLCDEIEAHNAAEESIFYAALLARSQDHRLARHAVDEHDEAAGVLAELCELETDSAAWRAGLAQLVEILEHHFDEEEGDAFAQARSLIGDDLAVQLGESFQQSKFNWIETFGRVPFAERRATVVVPRGNVARRAVGLFLRGRSEGWFKRFRGPLRGARFPRPASASPLSDSTPPRHLGAAGKALKRSRSF